MLQQVRTEPTDRSLAMRAMTEKHLAVLRRHMVEIVDLHFDLSRDEIGKDRMMLRVAEAMARVPRHLFVPAPLAAMAYQDTPLPIGFDKTISQPFICGLMLDLLDPQPGDHVLEVGTGLGYQSALLSELASELWTVEIVEEFAAAAELVLHQLGYLNVSVRIGDGSRGWPEHAPYQRILVSAAADEPPQALLDQLGPGGRLVMPVGGEGTQWLSVFDKRSDGGIDSRKLLSVRFTRLETNA